MLVCMLDVDVRILRKLVEMYCYWQCSGANGIITIIIILRHGIESEVQ